MKRHLLALGLLVVLAALAGCTAITGPGDPGEEQLLGNASYEWETSANATIEVNGTSFTGIYRLENRSSIDLFQRDGLGQEHALDVSALRFQHPNGSIATVSNSSMTAERGGGRTTVTLPGNVSGQLAFTADRFGKTFALPTFVEGSYDVTIPQGTRVGIPLLGQVDPGGFTTDVRDDGRMTVSWEDVESESIRISWYLQRDVYIFGTLVVVGIGLAIGGTLYYYRQIKRLKARREEVGLDVDVDSDDDPRDKGPPPGMR